MAVFLRAVSAAEPDKFLALVMLDLDGIAVEDEDNDAGEGSSLSNGDSTKQ